MNILIPHSWLLEHLNTKATPEQIQKYLSLCGPTVERIHIIKNEPVYDIEVTTNRVDCMSVRGIAREAAAILPQFNVKAALKPLKTLSREALAKWDKPLDLAITNNPKLCHRILAIKLDHVQLSPSPSWLKTRLEQVGQRPLNNVIDITNYVMWELGHPVHAFDYDRLTHKTIIVREAKKGEKLTTLDGKTHTLKGGEVVFDDGQGTIIDLPGIMGTQNTVVTQSTRHVLLWIESNLPEKIRSASMTHAIRTQAAILNEKNVDPELAYDALLRTVELIQKLAKGKVATRLIDIYPQKPAITSTTLNQDLIDTYLGVSLKPKEIITILESLGCNVKGHFTVTPPSWRAQDLKIPQDYIEEIARLYGYHNLPTVLMPTAIPDHLPADNFHLEHQIKTWLADWGLTEVYTYSLVAQSPHSLKIANPLTDDMVYLRQSLIPSHLQVIAKNKNRGEVSIFEMANVYCAPPKPSAKGGLPHEQLRLALTTNKDFLWLKGIVESLFRKLHIPATFTPTGIFVGKTKLGIIDRVVPNIYAADLLVATLINQSSLYPHYRPLPTTAPIIEDMTFTLPPQTYLSPIMDTIKSVSPLIESVIFKDRYANNFTFTIIYRNPKSQLTDQDVAPFRSKITSALARQL